MVLLVPVLLAEPGGAARLGAVPLARLLSLLLFHLEDQVARGPVALPPTCRFTILKRQLKIEQPTSPRPQFTHLTFTSNALVFP